MSSNEIIKQEILNAAKNAMSKGLSLFEIKNDRITITDHNGGYFTGYDVLNGSNGDVGGFEYLGMIYKLKGHTYVGGEFTFHDIVDVNKKYPSDIQYNELMKTLVMQSGHGVDYNIHITCKYTYMIN